MKGQPNTIESIMDRREPIAESGCYVWLGAEVEGYGQVRYKGRKCLVHRLVWERKNGPVPHGKVLDHLCRVRLCSNENHLEPVTHEVNILRGESFAAKNSALSECLRGHVFSYENTYWRKDGTGRVCRACRRDRKALTRRSHKKT